jgi:ribosomal protein L37AE/L43A
MNNGGKEINVNSLPPKYILTCSVCYKETIQSDKHYKQWICEKCAKEYERQVLGKDYKVGKDE